MQGGRESRCQIINLNRGGLFQAVCNARMFSDNWIFRWNRRSALALGDRVAIILCILFLLHFQTFHLILLILCSLIPWEVFICNPLFGGFLCFNASFYSKKKKIGAVPSHKFGLPRIELRVTAW